MFKLYTAPTVEPITLSETKLHLRAQSGSFADNVSSEQSIAPGAHVIAASYSLVGTAIDVLGYSVLVSFAWAGFGNGGTVDVKLQDSDDNSTWTDVTSGAFTQVVTGTANQTYEKAYTGGKHYLRVVCTVAGNTCSFGVQIVTDSCDSQEDDLISADIKAARQYCEARQAAICGLDRFAYINQTWELWLDEWPDEDYIDLISPLNEVSVTAGSFVTGTVYRILTVGTTDFTLIGADSNTVGVVFTATGAGAGTGTATASGIIKYYDTDNTVAYIDGADLFFDTNVFPGRISLAYGESWPSTTLRPHSGICVTFISGYGATSAYVPDLVKKAILLLVGYYYLHRGDDDPDEKTLKVVDNLLGNAVGV